MTINTITTTSAVAAVASPWWLPVLHSVSEFSALLLPIVGLMWIAVQIGFKLYTAIRHGPR